MLFETIQYESDGEIARLTLNRPDRLNAMTNRMLNEINEAVGMAENEDIRVLVIIGAGRGFCVGADLDGFPNRVGDEPLADDALLLAVRLHNLVGVTLAAVNGGCAGSGLALALACDLRIAAASAKLNTAFLDVGTPGDLAGPWTLSRMVGTSRARQLYLMPRKLTAKEAFEIGLIGEVVEDDRFQTVLSEWVNRLRTSSPFALRAMKANFLDAECLDLAPYAEVEARRYIDITRGLVGRADALGSGAGT
ncbi:MAG: enoyl-CoA hydratase/isomerase family protein [Acidimicrobiales bacterium]